MAVLVCEGVCNPKRVEIDAEVRASRERDARSRAHGGPVLPIDDHLASRLRALRHTRHQLVAGMVFACTECGAKRRFGNED